jgi:CRP/FNR family transcriptional regulator, nitrogen fixation regulation protein
MALGVGGSKLRGNAVLPRGKRQASENIRQNEVVTLRKRTIVFAEGAANGGIWEIVEGSLIVFKTLADGRRQITNVERNGGWLGTPDRPFYNCSAETLTKCRLRLHGIRDFSASSAMQSRYSEYLLRRVDELQDHALLLGRKSAMERIASFLLALPALGAPYERAPYGVEANAFAVALGQRDIGDYLGLKVETVSRNLATLKRRMIIATGKRGQFRLLDREALRAIAFAGLRPQQLLVFPAG